MQKHYNIKALFFLGIFSMLLLHQVLPHWHHQHEVEHSHSIVAHSDTHYHHQDLPENKNSKKGLLDLFLEAHIHTAVSNEILVTQHSNVKHLNVKKELKTTTPATHFNVSITYDEAEKFRVYHPPNKYFNPYLSSLDTRGPPTLA